MNRRQRQAAQARARLNLIAEFILNRPGPYLPTLEAAAFEYSPDLTVTEWAAALSLVVERLRAQQ